MPDPTILSPNAMWMKCAGLIQEWSATQADNSRRWLDILARNDEILRELYARKAAKPKARRRRMTLLLLWDLLAYGLPHGIRERIYVPTIGEMEEDRSKAYRRYRSRAARAVLRVLFLLRTCVGLLQCYRAWGNRESDRSLLVVVP